MRQRWYVGHKSGSRLEAFKSETTPTQSTHGDKYGAAIGPFRTKRAALWCVAHPCSTAQTVAQFERCSLADAARKAIARLTNSAV